MSLENKKAPEFSLKDQNNKTHKLSDIKADFIVLYFYPKDNTPGCTLEARDFTNNIDNFKKIKTSIFGISGLDYKSKKKFEEKHRLSLTLLADPDFQVSKKYRVYGQKQMLGRKYMGIYRTTFILDKNKKIIKIFEKVNPLGHAKEVLAFIKSQG